MTRKEEMESLSKKMGVELPVDGIASKITGKPVIDIVKADELLSANDPEYNHLECMYKGEQEVSLKQYITEKFGKEICEQFEKLMY